MKLWWKKNEKDLFYNFCAKIMKNKEILEKRAKALHNHGFKYAMIDVVVAGVAAVQTLRDVLGDYHMAIHAHRAMHAAFDRDEKHGITMQFLAKIMKTVGVDEIHSGTGVGKLVGQEEDIMAIASVLRDRIVKEKKKTLMEQNWGNIKPAFPVSSGGLHPG